MFLCLRQEKNGDCEENDEWYHVVHAPAAIFRDLVKDHDGYHQDCDSDESPHCFC